MYEVSCGNHYSFSMGHDRDIRSPGHGSRDRGPDFGTSTDLLVPVAAE